MKRDILVIGLGIYGEQTALALAKAGKSVLAMDIDRRKIERIKDLVTKAVVADASLEETLVEIDAGSFHTAIVGIGANFEGLILCVAHLKKLNVPKVITRANSLVQMEILKKVGADEVILPEHDAAVSTARKFIAPNIDEMLTVDSGLAIAEVHVPKEFVGKTLIELDLRSKYNLNAIMIKPAGQAARSAINPRQPFAEGDTIYVAGAEADIFDVFS